MRTTEARVFWAAQAEEERFLPEGPHLAIAPGVARLTWVNIQTGPDARAGQLFVSDPVRPEPVAVACPGRPGFLLPADRDGLAVAGLDAELRLCRPAAGTWHEPLAAVPGGDPRVIVNDGAVVPGGKAVVFGTKDVKFKDPIAALYLFTVGDNRVSVLTDRQTCSNGKVFRRDAGGLVLFDIDTPTRTVARYRLDVAARTATPDGVALDLADQPGFPDGMCDCGDGTVIVAFYNPDPVAAGRAVRFDLASGAAVEEWTTPGSPRVTCPLLVARPDGVKLILTTATEGMPADQRARCPNAGALFVADTRLETCPGPELVRLP
jgi:sugar lactone lactonase YvrE